MLPIALLLQVWSRKVQEEGRLLQPLGAIHAGMDYLKVEGLGWILHPFGLPKKTGLWVFDQAQHIQLLAKIHDLPTKSIELVGLTNAGPIGPL